MYRIIIVAKVAGCIAMCQKTRNVEQAQSTYTTNKEVSQFLSQTSQQLSSTDSSCSDDRYLDCITVLCR